MTGGRGSNLCRPCRVWTASQANARRRRFWRNFSLPADDASFLSGLIEPLFKQRGRRLTQRDDAIRRALDLLAGTTNPSARLAKQMALQERESRPERLTGDHLLVEALSEILRLNGGKAITARHIANIAAGTRSPWKLSAVEISTAKLVAANRAILSDPTPHAGVGGAVRTLPLPHTVPLQQPQEI